MRAKQFRQEMGRNLFKSVKPNVLAGDGPNPEAVILKENGNFLGLSV